MPELPETEVIRRYLDRHLRGRRITSVEVRLPRQIKWPDPQSYCGKASGSVIRSVGRRGKYLLIELEHGRELVFHLRMTGRLVLEPEGISHDPYARILFSLDNGTMLVYGDTRTLGRVYALEPGERYRIQGLAAMGPEPLSKEFTVTYFRNALYGRHVCIKTFLLDQKKIGGIGNIYADEALFLAGIYPRRQAGSLSAEECRHLHAAINQVIAAGIRDGGTTFRDYRNGEGRRGHHQDFLYVYHREGEPCRRCGTPIVKETVGGRGTHYCPHCQPGPADNNGGRASV
ncbi:bifunctional DNA-formamidopyrimidine glycosylase/DNA-(apurinic or apyrimidinic site) lyase [Selenomonas montiformis]